MEKEEKMVELTKSELKFKDGVISIVHNMPVKKGKHQVNTFDAALTNWLMRTKTGTCDDFIRYVNDKFKRGISEYWALRESEFNVINQQLTEKEQ
jgi:hypothetical protein